MGAIHQIMAQASTGQAIMEVISGAGTMEVTLAEVTGGITKMSY
jgi:hypothetical protein